MTPPSPADVPEVGELLDLVQRLDDDNERLRLRALEIMEWMQEAVTAQVAAERELEACRERAAALRRELEAIQATTAWRLLGPPRRLYAAARRRLGRPA